MNKKIDWVIKLSSRKFWMALVNLVTNILIVINLSDNQIAQVTALIMAGAGLIAYILSEGFIDGKREESNTYSETYDIREDYTNQI